MFIPLHGLINIKYAKHLYIKKKKYAKHLFPHHDYKSFKKKKQLFVQVTRSLFGCVISASKSFSIIISSF